MVRSIPVIVLLAFAAAACGGGDKTPTRTQPASQNAPTAEATSKPTVTSGDLSRFEPVLRTTYVAAVKETLQGSVTTAYGYNSSSFKAKCSLSDFVGLMAFARLFIGDLTGDDLSVEVTGVRYEGERAYVTAKVLLNGEDFSDRPDSDNPSYWVREDGAWKLASDDPEPCDSGVNSGEDGTKTPKAEGPGTTRDQAVAVGTPVRVGDLEVTVVSVNADAADVIASESDFPSTPVAGRRFVLVRVSVRHAGTGEDTVDASEGNFAITGSAKVLYESYDQDTSCGFDVPDRLDATLFSGGSAEGNVCFQIPASESGLILVVTPQFSFGAADRRFLSLQ